MRNTHTSISITCANSERIIIAIQLCQSIDGNISYLAKTNYDFFGIGSLALSVFRVWFYLTSRPQSSIEWLLVWWVFVFRLNAWINTSHIVAVLRYSQHCEHNFTYTFALVDGLRCLNSIKKFNEHKCQLLAAECCRRWRWRCDQ